MIQSFLSAIGVYKIYRQWLLGQIEKARIPEHIGIILDGNRRWASNRSLIPWHGHQEGVEKVRKFMEWCLDLGISTLTLYAFSTENFKRSKEEVDELMKMYEENLKELVNAYAIHENKVNIRAIGRINLLPERIRSIIEEVEQVTKDYDQFYLNFALAYGGRAEIVDATREIATLVGKGQIDPENIDEDLIEKHLYTAHLPQPDPDLIIRTSGEARLSNFLIWQAAYSELFIVDVYWPDFREIDLARAIRSYQNRHRRYGK
jgi:tritrans,polycis-undecaprenyl-diphosphate synthase [geranylgeranyl-diphosphate specific]